MFPFSQEPVRSGGDELAHLRERIAQLESEREDSTLLRERNEQLLQSAEHLEKEVAALKEAGGLSSAGNNASSSLASDKEDARAELMAVRDKLRIVQDG